MVKTKHGDKKMKTSIYFKSGLTLNGKGMSRLDEMLYKHERDNLTRYQFKLNVGAVFGLKGKLLDRFVEKTLGG